jgi:hypothetical protein
LVALPCARVPDAPTIRQPEGADRRMRIPQSPRPGRCFVGQATTLPPAPRQLACCAAVPVSPETVCSAGGVAAHHAASRHGGELLAAQTLCCSPGQGGRGRQRQQHGLSPGLPRPPTRVGGQRPTLRAAPVEALIDLVPGAATIRFLPPGRADARLPRSDAVLVRSRHMLHGRRVALPLVGHRGANPPGALRHLDLRTTTSHGPSATHGERNESSPPPLTDPMPDAFASRNPRRPSDHRPPDSNGPCAAGWVVACFTWQVCRSPAQGHSGAILPWPSALSLRERLWRVGRDMARAARQVSSQAQTQASAPAGRPPHADRHLRAPVREDLHRAGRKDRFPGLPAPCASACRLAVCRAATRFRRSAPNTMPRPPDSPRPTPRPCRPKYRCLDLPRPPDNPLDLSTAALGRPRQPLGHCRRRPQGPSPPGARRRRPAHPPAWPCHPMQTLGA